MAAMETGLATVTNLSAASVSTKDWLVQNRPYSVLIFPSLGGQQSRITVGAWEVRHQITCRLRVCDDVEQRLYDKMAAMIPLVLAWFRANDSLGLDDVITCHGEGAPITWVSTSADALIDTGASGVLAREVDFTVTVITQE